MKKYNYKTIPDLLLNEEWQVKSNTIETSFKDVRNQICNTFEILDSSGDIEPRMDEGSTKSEKAKQMDDDYSRMMQERGNDLSAKVN